jgi:ABC-type multidrug transport system permease subunit
MMKSALFGAFFSGAAAVLTVVAIVIDGPWWLIAANTLGAAISGISALAVADT